MKIGETIEKERKKKNISKLKLSELVGCTTRAIDYWENGERSISLENADKILNVLGITIIIENGSDLMNNSSQYNNKAAQLRTSLIKATV